MRLTVVMQAFGSRRTQIAMYTRGLLPVKRILTYVE
jgi:hypothetical protein